MCPILQQRFHIGFSDRTWHSTKAILPDYRVWLGWSIGGIVVSFYDGEWGARRVVYQTKCRYTINMLSHKLQGISNHRQIICLFNTFFMVNKGNIKAQHYWSSVKGIHRSAWFSPCTQYQSFGERFHDMTSTQLHQIRYTHSNFYLLCYIYGISRVSADLAPD